MMKKKNKRWVNVCSHDPTVYFNTEKLLERLHLHTVCRSAQCPNQGTCFTEGTATFLILGDTCTRNCTFCAVAHGVPQGVDLEEPHRISQAVAAMNLKHVVVTSVTRDDLPDGGAFQFAETIKMVRKKNPGVTIEVLIPDLMGSQGALKCILDERPEVLNHNLETIPRLYPKVRSQANYRRSLSLLQSVKASHKHSFTKSGIMVGLGEHPDEVRAVMEDLRSVACDFLTIGQYLRPSFDHYPVRRHVDQQEFESYKKIGEQMGFKAVFSSRLVRSSFMAGDFFKQALSLQKITYCGDTNP
jgi:lipoic acid synthetase